MRPLLTVRNLNVSLYDRPVLRDLSFDVLPHQAFVLLGPVGAGKSTLMHTLCALYNDHPNVTISGQILYHDQPIRPNFAPTLATQKARMLLGTVFDNLSEKLPDRASLTYAQRHDQITLFLCKLGLDQLAETLEAQVLDLTKVQRKKLLFANALLDNPALLAIDDPTIDLNAEQSAELLDFIDSLTSHCTILMTTDNPNHARAVGSVIGQLTDGRLHECRPSDEFFSTHDAIHSSPYAGPRLNHTPETFDNADSDAFLNQLPEIEFSPIHDGHITEPDYGSLPAISKPRITENPFAGPRPKTLTSTIPILTESNDDLPSVNEIAFDNDVFAVIEELYFPKDSRFLTRLKNRPKPQLQRNLRWLRNGQLAGTSRPGLLADIQQDLDALKRAGITHLITLSEEPLDPKPLQNAGIYNIHFPISDSKTPDLQAIVQLCKSVAELIADRAVLAYHCHAGIGLTGTMLTAQLIWEGLDTPAALHKVRSTYNAWTPTSEQEQFLTNFQQFIRS